MLGIFAILLPLRAIFVEISLWDVPFEQILFVIAFSVGIYAVYSFKKNDIYFNYSLMESEHYYKGVWKNIGKIAIRFAIMLLISLAAIFIVLFAFKNRNTELALRVILFSALSYVILWAQCSLLYFVYSVLERESYRSSRIISKASVVSLFIALALQQIWSAYVVFVNFLPISQRNAAELIVLSSFMNVYITFTFMIFLTYFGYEYLKRKQNSLLNLACIVILISQTLKFVTGELFDCLKYVFLPDLASGASNIVYTLSNINGFVSRAFALATIVGISMLIIALMKDCSARKFTMVLVIAIYAVSIGVEIFLSTQTDFITMGIYRLIREAVTLIFLCALVLSIREKDMQTFAEESNAE